jgi:hypothetical protein
MDNKHDYEDSFYNNYDEEMEMDQNKILENLKKQDRGYAQILAYKKRANGSLKRAKIDVYTSGYIGNYIRNAETGEYTKYLVGSPDENLFYSVVWATGECKSKNGSNVLFYTSPEHYMKHLNINLPISKINEWKEKYIDFKILKEKENAQKMRMNIPSVVIN